MAKYLYAEYGDRGWKPWVREALAVIVAVSIYAGVGGGAWWLVKVLTKGK